MCEFNLRIENYSINVELFTANLEYLSASRLGFSIESPTTMNINLDKAVRKGELGTSLLHTANIIIHQAQLKPTTSGIRIESTKITLSMEDLNS